MPDDVKALACFAHLAHTLKTYHNAEIHKSNCFALSTLAVILTLVLQLIDLTLVGEHSTTSQAGTFYMSWLNAQATALMTLSHCITES